MDLSGVVKVITIAILFALAVISANQSDAAMSIIASAFAVYVAKDLLE